MADKLAKRVHEINESSTIRMAKLSRELKDKGYDIINLSLGEPDFDTPEHIKEAAIQAIKDGYTHYPPVAGYPELRKALVDKFKRENNLTYAQSQVMVSTGAKQSIANVLLAILDEGDEILIPAPYWVSYPEIVKLTGAKSIIMPTSVENDYKVSPGEVEKAITPRTKAFIFSSPCNPTGSVYSKDELAALAEVFKKYPDIYIISDEIYEHINFEGKHYSIAQFPEVFERTIIINGLAKSFAMTGWRIGFTAGPEEVIKACEKIQGQFTSGANTIAQRASIAALEGSMQPTEVMKKAFRERRDLFVEGVKDIKGLKYNVPEGAFYLFPDVSSFFGKSYNGQTIANADDLCMYLLEHAQVSIVSGSGFGAENCMRISFSASKEDLEKAISRIKEALSKLK